MEDEFVSLLKDAYCEKLLNFQKQDYKILMENEMYQEVDFDILFAHVEDMTKRLANIFQVHLPYLTRRSKTINVKKFLQTGVVEDVWKMGSLELFVEAIMERLMEATPWIPNHLRDKKAWNVSWQHWLYALFNASMKNCSPVKVNKKLTSATLELHKISVVEWNPVKIWQKSGMKVRPDPNSNAPFEWEYYVNKDSDVETYGWRVFENHSDAESIIQNCEMRLILEGERRLMIEHWNLEEEKKRKKGIASSGKHPGRKGGFTREEVAKHFRNGKYTLEFGKKSSMQSFHEVFYGDKLADMKYSNLGFRS